MPISSPPPRLVFLDAATVGNDISLAPLEALGELLTFATTAPSQTAGRTAGATVALTNKVPIGADVLGASPTLRLVAVCATGVNQVDLEAARERGVAVCNVAGYSTASVAQHTLALLLNLATNAHRYAAEPLAWTRSPVFTRLDYPVVELAGKMLGIAGLGEIGSAVARAAQALGMRVQALARAGRSGRAQGDDLPRLPKPEFLATSDAVTLHCPLTPDTHHLIDAAALAAMKPGAFLINTGRGGLVDEDALVAALRSGHLGGAALDVLSTEPPPSDHPLLAPDIPNLILTPHTAWSSREARTRLIAEVAANIRDFFDGRARSRVV
jgi:glycerate dehydrogenase